MNPNNDWLTKSRCTFGKIDHRFCISTEHGQQLVIDFDLNHIDYFRKRHRGFQELIAKSLGLSSKKNRILDLSAGLGIDSVFLSQLGAKVTAIERHPAIHFLLYQAKELSKRMDLAELQFICADSKQFLLSSDIGSQFDAIYFDPMYPDKKKTALPRKEMVIFRNLVGDDTDSDEVFKIALEKNPGRLVVKRPVHADYIANEKPIHSFTGKTVRFDLYSR